MPRSSIYSDTGSGSSASRQGRSPIRSEAYYRHHEDIYPSLEYDNDGYTQALIKYDDRSGRRQPPLPMPALCASSYGSSRAVDAYDALRHDMLARQPSTTAPRGSYPRSETASRRSSASSTSSSYSAASQRSTFSTRASTILPSDSASNISYQSSLFSREGGKDDPRKVDEYVARVLRYGDSAAHKGAYWNEGTDSWVNVVRPG